MHVHEKKWCEQFTKETWNRNPMKTVQCCDWLVMLNCHHTSIDYCHEKVISYRRRRKDIFSSWSKWDILSQKQAATKWSFKLINYQRAMFAYFTVRTISTRDAQQACKSPHDHHRTSTKKLECMNASVQFCKATKRGGAMRRLCGGTVPGGHADISPVSKWETSVSRQQGSFLRVSAANLPAARCAAGTG